MLPATTAACWLAKPAILASAVETSPMAKTVVWPATWRVGPTSMNPSARRAAAKGIAR